MALADAVRRLAWVETHATKTHKLEALIGQGDLRPRIKRESRQTDDCRLFFEFILSTRLNYVAAVSPDAGAAAAGAANLLISLVSRDLSRAALFG